MTATSRCEPCSWVRDVAIADETVRVVSIESTVAGIKNTRRANMRPASLTTTTPSLHAAESRILFRQCRTGSRSQCWTICSTGFFRCPASRRTSFSGPETCAHLSSPRSSPAHRHAVAPSDFRQVGDAGPGRTFRGGVSDHHTGFPLFTFAKRVFVCSSNLDPKYWLTRSIAVLLFILDHFASDKRTISSSLRAMTCRFAYAGCDQFT